MKSQNTDPTELKFLDEEERRKTFYGIAAVLVAVAIGAMALYGTLQLTAA